MLTSSKFFRVGSCVYPVTLITHLDAQHLLSEGYITVSLSGHRDRLTVRGDEAMDLVMRVQPDILEGKNATYPDRAWTLHNMIGHPGMHILNMLGWHRFGKYVHDKTLPRPVTPLDLSDIRHEV